MDVIKQNGVKENGAKPNALFRFVYLYHDGILVLFVLALVAAMFSVGFYFYKDNVAAPYRDLANLEKTLSDESVKLATLKAAKVDLSQMEDSIKRLYSALPYDADLPGLYLQINEIVKKNGMTLGSFNAALPKEGASKDRVQAVELNLNISGGDYFALKKLLADAATSLRLMDVRALTYSPLTQSYTVILGAYYLLED
jgi:Tfp pilus assembly protein PilO